MDSLRHGRSFIVLATPRAATAHDRREDETEQDTEDGPGLLRQEFSVARDRVRSITVASAGTPHKRLST